MTNQQAVAKEALLNLLDARDFLGYQLSYANGGMDKETFDAIAAKYLYSVAPTMGDLADRIEVLLDLLPPERLDADAVSVMLNCGIDQAEGALTIVASRIRAQRSQR
jgi:hypothetical protein